MYNTILLAIALQRWERYSAHALAARDAAAALARATSNRLHVLSAYEYEYMPAMPEVPSEMVANIREQHTRHTDALMVQKLDEYVAPLTAAGIAVTKVLRVGNARDVIVDVAASIQADLLIIGSHSKRGILDIALGGTAQYVSRHAPCTVVLVSPKVSNGSRRD
jgi:nucleotide-binding universal stress UspA family protein